MKPLSDLLEGLEALFQKQADQAYQDFRSVATKPVIWNNEVQDDEFLFGGEAPASTMVMAAPRGGILRVTERSRSSSGVTYDPTHSNWIGRDVIPGMKFDQHSPGVISAKLS